MLMVAIPNIELLNRHAHSALPLAFIKLLFYISVVGSKGNFKFSVFPYSAFWYEY